MVSTLLGYRLYATNISKSLERVEAAGNVKREAEYYAAKIGEVGSVDDFLNDYRLYSYAMKAYGLEDQIASKGLMRKVLESDLGDASSFANKLTDNRYRSFAAAFNFRALASTDTKVVQSTAQTESLVEAYSEHRVRQGVTAAAKTSAYAKAMETVRSVDDILGSAALFEVVVGSVGADPGVVSRDFVRHALTGTLPDGVSTANPGWLRLHERFNFAADGSLDPAKFATPTSAAQDRQEIGDLIYDYNAATGNDANPYAAAFNADYFAEKTAALTDIRTLFTDKRLFSYVMTAFGFDASIENPDYAANVVLGGSGPGSPISALPTDTAANRARKEKFVALQGALNAVRTGGPAELAAQQQQTTDAYFANYRATASARDAKETSTFKFMLGNINSVTDLLARDPVFGRDALEYVLEAFDIDPATTSLATIRRALTSDVSDPASYVNRMGDERFEKLAAAFNFDADGNARSQRLVQSVANQTATGTRYAASFGSTTEARRELVRNDTKAYLTAIGNLRTLDDFLDDDETLRFALRAYGLDEVDLGRTEIRRILTSDLGDRDSFANAANDNRYVQFAKAFNFTPQGTVMAEETSGQTAANRLTTANLFLLQTLETRAGDENEGVRLGLYFLRKAPDLTSTAAILADKALLEVVRTALGLPDGFTQLGIERQIAILDGRLEIADFTDAKKLDKFISRFASLYDIANPGSVGGSSPILQLFGGSSASAGLLGMF